MFRLLIFFPGSGDRISFNIFRRHALYVLYELLWNSVALASQIGRLHLALPKHQLIWFT